MTRTPVHEVITRPAHLRVSETTRGRTFTAADLAAVAAATATALHTMMQETATRTPAPPPLTPAGTGDQGDAWHDRASSLLGSFAKTPPRSYSLSDLVVLDPDTDTDDVNRRVALDQVFGGRLRN